jgi:iron complex outermembrane receptor protein
MVRGDQYLNDSNSLEYPGYSLINLKLTSRIRLKRIGPVSLYAGINNLSDTRYASMLVVNATGFAGSESRYYYPGHPRHVFIGARYVF